MKHEPFEALHDTARRDFASDNYAGMHPRVVEALAAANGGHQGAYGADDYTQRLQEVVRGHFGDDAIAYPVFNGTGANVLALQSMLPRWGAVIAATTAHIHVDEGGAPERTGGLKLLTVETEDGKLTPNSSTARHGVSGTSTAPRPASCRSRSRANWVRSTRPTRSPRSPNTRTDWG